MIGAAEGTGEIALNIARDTVLNTWTFGGYGAYKLGSALWAGYEEDGVVGAINSVTRAICPQCAAAIEASGGTLTGPTTAVWPR